MNVIFPEPYNRKSLETLDLALGRVQAYAAWKSRDTGGTADERYAALPALTKADLRLHGWEGFVPAGRDVVKALEEGRISLVKTSGTTDEQVVNVWHQPWWDRSEEMSWAYNPHLSGLRYGKEFEAILTSPRNTGILSDERDLTFDERRLERFLYLNERSNPLLWDDTHMDRMLSELRQFRPSILEANPSYLARLALYAWKNGREVWQPSVIVLTYENARPLARHQIGLAFSCPVVSSFGSTETGYVFMECEAGRLHQNSGSCRVDIVPLPGETGRRDLGRVLVTTFDNDWRVLVRFDTGDLVRLETTCPCGRNHGLIASEVAGRTADLTFDPEGRAVTPIEVDRKLCGVERLVSYRIEQHGRSAYRVEVETEDGGAVGEVRERLETLYGKAEYIVTPVRKLEPLPSGKYRYAGSRR